MPVARNDSVCGGGAPEAVRSSARPSTGGALMPVRLWPITCSRECVASMCLSLLGSHPSPAPAGCFRVPLCGLIRNVVDQLGSGSPDVVFRNHVAERSIPVEMVTVFGGSRTVVELPAARSDGLRRCSPLPGPAPCGRIRGGSCSRSCRAAPPAAPRRDRTHLDAVHQDDSHAGKCVVVQLAYRRGRQFAQGEALSFQRHALLFHEFECHCKNAPLCG